ncbi:MAG: hypothetical protein LUC32_06415 [Clostridiales bacterium]|nr:hypothetical protein [Clostridiales bacterium]
MKKTKSFIAILIIGIAAVAAMAAVIVYAARSGRRVFSEDSSIAYAAEDMTYAQALVTEGSAYRYLYPDSVSVKDSTSGESVALSRDSFAVSGSGAVTAFNDGTLVDVSRLSSGITQSYSVETGAAVYRTADGYSVYNNDIEITMTAFLWKLSGEKYMVGADGLLLSFPDGSTYSPTGTVEFEWVEDGIVQTLADGQCWTTVVSGYRISWNGGSLDLETEIITDANAANSITLATLDADASSESVVLSSDEAGASSGTKAFSWVFTIINGTDGDEGSEGASGDSGSDGTAGSDSAAGVDGVSGLNGALGRTGSGAEDDETVTDATVALNTYTVTDSSIEGTFTLEEGSWTLADITLQIRDESGAVVAAVAEGSADTAFTLFEVTDSYDADEVRTITVNFAAEGLDPDTQYTIVLYASYYNGDDYMGTKAFISRGFYTDSDGVQVRTAEISSDSATLTVTRGSSDLAISLSLAYTDSSGDTQTITVSEAEIFGDSSDLSTDVALSGLASDTLYSVTVYTDGTAGEVYEFTTLKAAITYGTLQVETGIGSSTLSLSELDDPDNSVTEIRYLIYDAADTSQILAQVSGDTSSGEAVVVFDDENLKFTTGNIANSSTTVYNYTVKAQIICNDNEKEVVYEMWLADGTYLRSVKLPDTSLFLCTAESTGSSDLAAALTANALTSGTQGSFWLQYETNGQYMINFGYVDQSDLYLVIYSADPNYRIPQVYQYTAYDLNGSVIMTAAADYTQFRFFLNLTGLKSGTQYYVYIYGDYTDIARYEAGMDNYSGFAMLGYCTFTTP